MPFRQISNLPIKPVKRSEGELTAILQFIREKEEFGQWRKVELEKIVNECREKWKERDLPGECEFEFQEFFLHGKATQMVRCSQEQCKDRDAVLDLRGNGSWYDLRPISRHLRTCQVNSFNQ